jgi:DNA-binding transcriptional LysR family regulator
LFDDPIANQEYSMQWSDRIGRRLKLRDLHILMAVAKAGSMGRAAADLAISQPSISKAIADVEHAIGLQLFDRRKRGVEPTMYGRALLECGVAVFDELRQGVKQLEFLRDPTVGELRIGCNESLAAGFVAAVLDQMSSLYPGVVFHLVPADRAMLLSRELPQRTIELAVTTISALDPQKDIEIVPLFDDRFVVMAGAHSRWARRRRLRLRQLLNEPWVLPPEDSLPGMRIAEIFRAEGLEPPQPRMVSFSIPLHQHLLATEAFVTMLPASMLRFGKHLPLKQLAVATPAKTFSTGVIRLKNRTLSPVAQLFVECALQIGKAARRAA